MNSVRPALCERTNVLRLFFGLAYVVVVNFSFLLHSFIKVWPLEASAGKLLALNQPNEENIFFHIVNYYRHEEKQ